MKPFKKFLALLTASLFVMAVIAILADGGFRNFIFRPVFLTVGFMAIVTASHAFVFDLFQMHGFWKWFAVAALFVFVGAIAFSLTANYMMFDPVSLWIAVSQGLVCVIFLLATILITTLIGKSASVRTENPVIYFKISSIAALVTFLVTAAMNSDQFLIHGQSFDVFLGTLKLLAIFASLNCLLGGSLLYLFSHKSFWQSRPWALALVVPPVMTAIDAVVFNRYFHPHFPKIVAVYFVCTLITLLMLAMLIFRNKTIRLSRMSFAFAHKEAEYLQLKRQIDPHFLFNNLNTMISFIETHPAKAVAFGHHLSDVYRHFLKSQPEEFVPLAGEMEFLEGYFEIFRAKFNGGFTVLIESCNFGDKYVLSLATRELADNFFKHNMLDVNHPPELRIYCTSTHLVFENTVDHKVAYGKGTGLENILRRYKILTGMDAVVEKGDVFTVKLPLLEL